MAVGTKDQGGGDAPQILVNQFTLFQLREASYAHHITTLPLMFLDLPTTLDMYICTY